MLAFVKHIDRSRFEPIVLLFEPGPLEQELRPYARVILMPLPSALIRSRRAEVQIGLSTLSSILTFLPFLARLAKTIKSVNPDLVHTNSLKADVLAGFAARLIGVPVIWHVRDRIDTDYLPGFAVSLIRLLSRCLPTLVIANSASTLATLPAQLKKRSQVISSGLDLAPFAASGQNSERLSEAIEAGREIRIGLVGRICRWKGQHIFIEAAEIVRRIYPNARFLIIGAPLFGEDAYQKELETLVIERHLETGVEFLGFRKNMPETMANLHLVAHTSIIPEPFGQVIIQGMAAGKPVIATEGGGPSEIIQNTKTGRLIRRADSGSLAAAIIETLDSPNVAETMAFAAQEEALTKYGIGITAPQIERAYLDACPSRKPYVPLSQI